MLLDRPANHPQAARGGAVTTKVNRCSQAG